MDDIGDTLLGVTQNDEESPADLNISEVLHAISIADPTFGAGVGVEEMYRQASPSVPQPSGAPRTPYVRIVEQPAGKSLRFRYECEGRSAGSIPGVNSTPERKTYPTIEVVGYTGRFVVLVSCVTRDKPYRPHPHNLVGREPMCNRGVCTVEVNGADSSLVQFSNLGIQCVKRKDIAEALKVREEIKVDPFKTGFAHKSQPQNIDLNAVRLCFQVYIPGGNTSKIKQALAPVVSDVIYDKKAMCELQINRLSTCAASVRGGTEIILLCEKVTRDDVEVVFSQAFEDGSVWEAPANIVLVHKQVAIAFQVPPYRDPTFMDHAKVKIFLKRVSDSARSVPVDFEYTPDYADTDYLSKKKRKTAQSIDSFLQSTYKQDRAFVHDSAIKTEPRDSSPGLQVHSPPMGVGSPHYPPPQYHEPDRYQQWIPEASNLTVTSTNPFHADNRGYWGPQNFGHTSPSPNLAVSPTLQTMSPNLQTMSPNLQTMSPNLQTMSPNMQAVSPNMQAVSPAHRLSPSAMQQTMQPGGSNMPMSQGLVQMSPMAGGLSPMHQQSAMHQQSPMHQPSPMLQPSPMHQQSPMHLTSPTTPMQNMQVLQNVPQPMEGDSLVFNSADLSGIIASLGAEPGRAELSDSLRQLSTSDLIPTMQHM